MLKNVLLATVVPMIFVLGLIFGLIGNRWFIAGHVTTRSSAALLTQVQNLHHLVTVKYVLEKVVVYDDVKWYGDSRVILVAHGVVKAGIDLSMLRQGDIQAYEGHISLQLPPPRITDVYLDDHRTQILERSTGLLRSFDKDLEQNARELAVAELREAAGESGILKDATERAEGELTALFQPLGYTNVQFRQK
jgi:hypothetical protein